MHEILEFVKRRWKLLLFVDFGIGGVGIVLCFTLPHVYVASATFFITPSPYPGGKEEAMFLGFPSEILYPEVFGVATTRWVMDRVIKKEHLMEHYRVNSMEEAYFQYITRLRLEVFPDGFIRMSFIDSNPEKAYRICKEILHAMEEFFHNEREYYYTQYLGFLEKVEGELIREIKTLGDSIKYLSRRYTLIPSLSLSEDIYPGMEEVRKELVKKEIEYLWISYSTPESPEAKKVKAERDLLYKRWGELVKKGIKKVQWTVPPADTLYSSYLKLFRMLLLKELKEEVYEFLRVQSYHFFYQKEKELPVMYVIDPPVVPEKRSFPKRKKMSPEFLIIAVWLT